jgi:hypothetical protein
MTKIDQNGQKWTKNAKKTPFQISTFTKSASLEDPSSRNIWADLKSLMPVVGCTVTLTALTLPGGPSRSRYLL